MKRRAPSGDGKEPESPSDLGGTGPSSEESRDAEKYHVALSFAGEDREYVQAVAERLRESGVSVFYDRFEETKLWGKDLYAYLSDIYQNRAIYTVVFISKAYGRKLWTNLERKAAQARAFSESREYLLPAVFDPAVEIPGVLKTTGYIDLKGLAPERFADTILKKLQDDGVVLAGHARFSYSSDAKADVDFHLSGRSSVLEIIKGLKSHDWYTQRPAMEGVASLDWIQVSQDQAFVLGRNIYQCACGTERTASAFLGALRRELAQIPPDAAAHLLNGMFYEVYFDSKGEFRQDRLKSERMNDLFALQTVAKYSDVVAFIRQALSPYRDNLVVLPATTPEIVTVRVKVTRKDPPIVRSVECFGEELLDIPARAGLAANRMWRLSLKQFSVETLRASMSEAWYVPLEQLKIELSPALPEDAQLRLPEDKTILRPAR